MYFSLDRREKPVISSSSCLHDSSSNFSASSLSSNSVFLDLIKEFQVYSKNGIHKHTHHIRIPLSIKHFNVCQNYSILILL